MPKQSNQSPRRAPSGQTQQRRTRAKGSAPRHAAAHARPQSQPPKKRKSPVIPIIVTILTLALVGGAGFFIFSSISKRNADKSADETAPAAEEVAAEVIEEPQPTQINLLMVGDMLFHYQVRMSGLMPDGSRNYDHLFTHVLSELEGQDIKVINQETPIAGPIYEGSAPDGFDGYPEFNGPQEVGDAEAKAGFNVVLRATNHAMDNSGVFEDPYALVRSEQNFWANQHPEVAVIGEGNPDVEGSDANNLYVYEKDGFRVALLNFTFDLNGNEAKDYLGMVSMLEETHVRDMMARARQEADMIVVFPHWGEEYSLEPIDEQYTWANIFLEEGADAIIGNHPHVIEPATVLTAPDGQMVPCFWSTGNFVSTSPSDESLVGGIAKVTLQKDLDGTCSVTAASFTPIVTHLGLSTDMTTYLLRDWTDDLAASNWLDTEVNPATYNTTLTPAWANDFCVRVLGPGFDTTRKVLDLDLVPSLPSTTDGQTAY